MFRELRTLVQLVSVECQIDLPIDDIYFHGGHKNCTYKTFQLILKGIHIDSLRINSTDGEMYAQLELSTPVSPRFHSEQRYSHY